jgi:hypothetical protein
VSCLPAPVEEQHGRTGRVSGGVRGQSDAVSSFEEALLHRFPFV